MSPGEWSQKAKLQLVPHEGDNDQKHYMLSGQFWEHFQLLEEKRFVKLEKLACWHWQGIHNAHVNLRERRGAGSHTQRKAPGHGRKAFNQRHESLSRTIKINVFIISLICRYKKNRQYVSSLSAMQTPLLSNILGNEPLSCFSFSFLVWERIELSYSQ